MPGNENFTDLDQLFYQLSNGLANNSTVKQFEDAINDSVASVKESFNTSYRASTSGTTQYRSNRSTKAATYRSVRPHVLSEYQNKYYASRYQHVTSCLQNVSYTSYPEVKIAGCQKAIEMYLDMIEKNAHDLRPVENHIKSDLRLVRKKLQLKDADLEYLNGYYDGAQLVLSTINNSKLQRLQELNNMF